METRAVPGEKRKSSPQPDEPAEARELIQLVYDDLRRIAECRVADEWRHDALTAGDLVHEAFLRVVDRSELEWRGPAHFMAVCSRAFRRVLVDQARYDLRVKRGGDRHQVALDPQAIPGSAREASVEDLLSVAEALQRLALLDPRQALVVEYRFFSGMQFQEIAAFLGVSQRTVHRDWSRARAWLKRELNGLSVATNGHARNGNGSNGGERARRRSNGSEPTGAVGDAPVGEDGD